MKSKTQIERVIAQKKEPIDHQAHKQNYLKLCQFMQKACSERPCCEGCIYSEKMLIAAQEQLRRASKETSQERLQRVNEDLKLAVLDNLVETAQEYLYLIAENPDWVDTAIRHSSTNKQAGNTQQPEMQKYGCIKLCQFLQTQYGNPYYHEGFVYLKEITIYSQVQLRKSDVSKKIIAWGLLQTAMECIRLIAANLDQSKMQKEVAVPEKEATNAG